LAAPTHLLRRALAAATLVLVLGAAPASASVIDPTSPHSPNADHMATAYWAMLIVAVLVIVLVNVALLVAMRNFREKRDRRPPRLAAGRGVVLRAGIGLGILAVALFVFGVVMTNKTRTLEPSGPDGLTASAARYAQVGLENPPVLEPEPGAQTSSADTQGAPAENGGPLIIDAVAQQWLWRFEYPGNNPQGLPLFSYAELVVPVDTTVILNITSTDVMNTWWVPSLGGQVQAVPGTESRTWFKADEVGLYRGASTTFSGSAYPAMRSWVRVVTPDEYQAYLDKLQADLQEAQDTVERQLAEGTGPIAETQP
jgi:cytochrome c oxidase subunit 2